MHLGYSWTLGKNTAGTSTATTASIGLHTASQLEIDDVILAGLKEMGPA